MIVYIESNFVLELILRQEESRAATELLQLARRRQIDLRIPAFALLEPAWTLARNSAERERSIESLTRQQTQIVRSRHREDVHQLIGSVTDRLRKLRDEDLKRYDNAIRRITRTATVVDLTGATVSASLRLKRRFGMGAQDAAILATIAADLRQAGSSSDSVLATRDKDFADPEIKGVLARRGCRTIVGYREVVQYVRQRKES